MADTDDNQNSIYASCSPGGEAFRSEWTPEELLDRLKSGKPAAGAKWYRSKLKGEPVVIADDGSGMLTVYTPDWSEAKFAEINAAMKVLESYEGPPHV